MPTKSTPIDEVIEEKPLSTVSDHCDADTVQCDRCQAFIPKGCEITPFESGLTYCDICWDDLTG